MRDDNPGDLGVRLSFARVYGPGVDAGAIRPSLIITDGTSGKNVEMELTPEDLAEIFAGGQARVAADKVHGFKALRDFGKFHHHMQLTVKSKADDYTHQDDPSELPHVMEAMSRIAAAGYTVEKPSLSHGQWRVIGRKYTDSRDA